MSAAETTDMKRPILVAAAVMCGAVLSMAGTAGAASDGPTCADSPIIDVVVHGQHVVSDYVTGTHDVTWPPSGQVGDATSDGGAAVPGGPGPRFHWTEGVLAPPGASFCTGTAQSARAVVNQRASDHVPDVR